MRQLRIKAKFNPKNEIVEIDRGKMGYIGADNYDFELDEELVRIEVRANGEFKGKALYLDNKFDWEMGLDPEGFTILVPLRKD